MSPHGYTIRTPGHPLLRALYFVVVGVVLIAALLMGAVILSVALGLAIVVGIVAFVRAWWLGRGRPRGGHSPPSAREFLEVEYSVVEEREERKERKEREDREERDARGR